MATFYLDLENGNDASAGTSWATAWKTINNGATAARTAPGDTIRIAKTGDPTSIGNATWTSKSATVTLASAQTTTIDNCETGWTAANSGAVAPITNRKQGTYCFELKPSTTPATTTKYAYKDLGTTLNLSSYDSITFWIWAQSNAVLANNYQIKLCSDTLGDTAVDTFDIPAISSTGVWIPITLQRVGTGALGNAIKSIAWYTGSVAPVGSYQVRLDNISGCNNNGLNLQSLISKNSNGFTDITTNDTWHGLQSIDGTNVILGNDNSTNASSANLKGYYTTGTSPATVTTYIRPTYKFAMQSSSSGSAQPIQEGGTSMSAMITYSGGWNTSSNTQDGETWIDGQSGNGYGLDIGSSKSYIKLERLGACRFNYGFYFGAGATNGHIIDNCQFICCSTGVFGTSIKYPGTQKYSTNNNITSGTANFSTNAYMIYVKALNNVGSFGIPTDSKINTLIYNNNSAQLGFPMGKYDYVEHRDNTSGIQVQNTGTVEIQDLIMTNNLSFALSGSGSQLTINKLTASGNASMGTYDGLLTIKQTNAASTQLIGSTATSGFKNWHIPTLMYNAVNNDINDNRFYWWYGNGLSQTTTRHTASGVAWQINITNTAQTSELPIYFPIAKVACNASSLVTVKAWVKLSHATDIGAKLMIQANEIAGVTADVTATKSADTNWEELTITFTPTVAGVAQIYVQGYWLANLADESIYVDDITVTQA